ncbi:MULTISPECIES: DUF2934 domain-containing protein [Mesorhizobium]|uniref:DUF2934 domain-containing protein n=1 Tax=Mesorhizobium sp. TaxID=1871066 RepID=UPI0004946A85|nr:MULTISPECIES: DUF2934 domain-containing protein [Mesorhizobium]RWM68016.1 MAG: DUF2934 domain-containing protein [Mesorhizobium sp.]TIO22104.1 MAG: DUF2934 domain-containing protein [Mesorhizobium sp.]TJV62064.1 MAG: DUF2934 domain-containing protein [Mesorhizobium sp.]
MTDDRQERIRQRAHAIWEQAGRPHGAHQQHWDQATAEIDGEESRPKAKDPATGKATKPKAVRPRKSSAS